MSPRAETETNMAVLNLLSLHLRAALLVVFSLAILVFCGATHERVNVDISADGSTSMVSEEYSSVGPSLAEQVRTAITESHERIMGMRNSDGIWVMNTNIGKQFVSEYYIVSEALGWTEKSTFNVSYFTELLLESQQPNGGWLQVEDPASDKSVLDDTVFHYWFLKATGHSIDSAVMQHARAYILSKGGLAKVQMMLRFKLSLFGMFPWEKVIPVPYFLFHKNAWYSRWAYVPSLVAQWVQPHMTALCYFRLSNHRLRFDLGPRFDIRELWINLPPALAAPFQAFVYPPEPDPDVVNLLKFALSLAQPKGAIGAYSVSTYLNIVALQDFVRHYPEQTDFDLTMLAGVYQRGFEFLETNLINSNLASHRGSVVDGRYWDSMLVLWGLLESGYNKYELIPAVDFLIAKAAQPNGGFAYGLDLEYVPDTDDTGVMLNVLGFFGEQYRSQSLHTIDWLYSMQNDDGGYGAFFKNCHGNFLYDALVSFMADSAEIWDPSSVDVTAHVVEGWLNNGVEASHPAVKRAMKYFAAERRVGGLWQGRWGVNYIYALGQLIPVAARAGENLHQPHWRESIEWLMTHQNEDGGFGESTQSYLNQSWAGRGVSTASQTAFGLLVLVEAAEQAVLLDLVVPSMQNAVTYLMQNYADGGKKWIDSSAVGTGHRGIIFMVYPAYPNSFPLVALGRYERLMRKLVARADDNMK